MRDILRAVLLGICVVLVIVAIPAVFIMALVEKAYRDLREGRA